ncbi:MAG: hypothetical protein ACR2P6_07810 [Gammaproteobacteria bacterium]
MPIRLEILFVACLLMCSAAVHAEEAAGAAFQVVETETFDDEDFIFPDDCNGSSLNILFLALSDDQDNGQYQQEALLAWHAALEAEGVFSAAVKPYHFPVLKSPPFFVKGIIAGAMSDSYEGKVPLDQAGVMFIKDLSDFAAAAKIPLDSKPTIIIASAEGVPQDMFKGEVGEDGIAAIKAAISERSGTAP